VRVWISTVPPPGLKTSGSNTNSGGANTKSGLGFDLRPEAGLLTAGTMLGELLRPAETHGTGDTCASGGVCDGDDEDRTLAFGDICVFRSDNTGLPSDTLSVGALSDRPTFWSPPGFPLCILDVSADSILRSVRSLIFRVGVRFLITDVGGRISTATPTFFRLLITCFCFASLLVCRERDPAEFCL